MRTYLFRRNGQPIVQKAFSSLSMAEAYGAILNADEVIIKHNYENNQNQETCPAKL